MENHWVQKEKANAALNVLSQLTETVHVEW